MPQVTFTSGIETETDVADDNQHENSFSIINMLHISLLFFDRGIRRCIIAECLGIFQPRINKVYLI